MDTGDWLGLAGTVLSLGWAILTEWNAGKERRHMHSFLKGLKTGVMGEANGAVYQAINDEMERLIPPKKAKS